MPQCPVCEKEVKVTGEGRWYKHPKSGPRCDASGTLQSLESTSTYSGSTDASTMTPDEWMDSDGKPPLPEPTSEELELAARIKETFYAYTNRADRSQQSHLGPSEVGTPCDRRLALHMLGMRPVNPGGDNWASFKGTCIHAGLADLFTWADAGSGRYSVEMRVDLPSSVVPRGTLDRIDRVLCLVLDDKVMGGWSLDKLKRTGATPTQWVQLHLYAYAARRRGERVDKVALVAWPMEESSLDGLVTWVRDYDPTVAPAVLERADRIRSDVRRAEDEWQVSHDGDQGRDVRVDDGTLRLLEIASEFKVADDCRYCPYYAPDDSERQWGCNGKQ